VRESLESLRALGPEHVSLYELTIEEKTLFGELHKKGKLPVPTEEGQLETLSKARIYLQRHGWKHYELLSYAKPGRESRHNRLYWDNADTLGLGPGAWSHWKGRRWRRAASYRDYLSKIEVKNWSFSDDETLSPEKKEIESFVLGLRMTEGVLLERFAAVVARFADEIASLTEKGLLTRHKGKLCLTPRGQFFAESVFSELSA
jgi:coproporphyrinogen III oxidase-like Fe-S oxidoreductase